ncbi:hypothetical protein [Nonomuraea zeae]|uniref:hypothetical protein n=1 Tax=Nonomuraea zeae TaxID=1642303 RepID=UPI003613EAAD
MEIVAFGDSDIIYRDGGVWVTKITFQGWYALQLKWRRHADYEAVTKAIVRAVPKGAQLRQEQGPSSTSHGYGWVYDLIHERNYLQWEPLKEEAHLAQVS